jgi:hypothetical protein
MSAKSFFVCPVCKISFKEVSQYDKHQGSAEHLLKNEQLCFTDLDASQISQVFLKPFENNINRNATFSSDDEDFVNPNTNKIKRRHNRSLRRTRLNVFKESQPKKQKMITNDLQIRISVAQPLVALPTAAQSPVFATVSSPMVYKDEATVLSIESAHHSLPPSCEEAVMYQLASSPALLDDSVIDVQILPLRHVITASQLECQEAVTNLLRSCEPFDVLSPCVIHIAEERCEETEAIEEVQHSAGYLTDTVTISTNVDLRFCAVVKEVVTVEKTVDLPPFDIKSASVGIVPSVLVKAVIARKVIGFRPSLRCRIKKHFADVLSDFFKGERIGDANRILHLPSFVVPCEALKTANTNVVYCETELEVASCNLQKRIKDNFRDVLADFFKGEQIGNEVFCLPSFRAFNERPTTSLSNSSKVKQEVESLCKRCGATIGKQSAQDCFYFLHKGKSVLCTICLSAMFGAFLQ